MYRSIRRAGRAGSTAGEDARRYFRALRILHKERYPRSAPLVLQPGDIRSDRNPTRRG